MPFKGLCVAVLHSRRNSIQKAGRTLGASQFLSFPGREHTSAQRHSLLRGPRRPSTAELATGSEAQQGVGILPKIQYPYFSPMNWPRLGLHCYLCVVLMEFLSSLPFWFPHSTSKTTDQASNSIVWFQRHLFNETSLLSKNKLLRYLLLCFLYVYLLFHNNTCM